MKRFRYMLAALVLVFVGALPSVSMALPQFATSIIYFDANDNLIGNQNLYCNAVSEHAGIIDQSNLFRVEMKFGCGDPYISCNNLGLCQTVGHNTVDAITYFHSGTGRTVENYCLDPAFPGSPFYGKKDCSLPAPSRMTGLGWAYLPGFGG